MSIHLAEQLDFGDYLLPYGIFSTSDSAPRVGVAVGSDVLDLASALNEPWFESDALNLFLGAGCSVWAETRSAVERLIADGRLDTHLHPSRTVDLHLPFRCGDFVDFYSSIEHATNAGRILRPDQEPLRANWRHIPVGYYGRASSVIRSGSTISRPLGHVLDGESPSWIPSGKLDFEAEMGFVIGKGSTPGLPIDIDDFDEHVFGVLPLLDWSARDIQAFEAVPLGPFLAKSFATSISPWVVPLAALKEARVDGPIQQPQPHSHLRPASRWGLDIALEVRVNNVLVSSPSYKNMYWTADQQLTHLTSNGSHVNPGDLYGSGTISDAGEGGGGTLLELTWDGRRPLDLGGGQHRGYLLNGDQVAVRAFAQMRSGGRHLLGEVSGRVVGASREGLSA